MSTYLEAWKPSGTKLVPLEADRMTVGKDPSNDLVIDDDPTTSRHHALFERFGAGWSVRDVGSRNGTTVNGERIQRERVLHPGDEIRIGKTRLVFRSDDSANITRTEAAERPPDVTRRERDVLVSLCRPLLSGDLFTDPATVKEIAAELVVSDAAVKQHLLHLYDKFRIHEDEERRRVRLANEAIRRGAVSVADLGES